MDFIERPDWVKEITDVMYELLDPEDRYGVYVEYSW